MKTLSQFIIERKRSRFNESLELEDDSIIEGIEILPNKIVKLNDSDKGVDFEGPIYWEDNNIDIISIFRRTKLNQYKGDKDLDGNPFIYALKNKNGWKFEITQTEIRKYLNKFISNCEKLQKKYDTIIMIPSKSSLNERFMNYLYDILKAKNKITNFFSKTKLNVAEPESFIDYEKLKRDKKDTPYIINYIEEFLYDLNESDREFEAKNFDKSLLKYLNFLTRNKNVDYVKAINNKNILVLDDIYSSGTTISQAVEAIKQSYDPKSITVVTLLSKIF